MGWDIGDVGEKQCGVRQTYYEMFRGETKGTKREKFR